METQANASVLVIEVITDETDKDALDALNRELVRLIEQHPDVVTAFRTNTIPARNLGDGEYDY